MASGSGSRSPCGACKFLRRKCASDCVFAPYFFSEQGAARFAAIHKVFGASNVSKLLLHVPVADRCEAVVTIAYEAQARIRDPVYGCVAHIFALQRQVASLQAKLMQATAQLAQNAIDSRNNVNHHNQWAIYDTNGGVPNFPTYQIHSNFPISSQSSLDSNDHGFVGVNMQEIQSRSLEQFPIQTLSRKATCNNTDNLCELQALALRMIRN